MESRASLGKQQRETGLELLRILCLLTIISQHFITQSGIWSNHSIAESLFFAVGISLSRVSCSVFVIISAWFSVDKPFRTRKIAHVWLTVIMYTVPILIYGYNRGIVDSATLRVGFFPVESSPLWFAGYYIVLCLFMPSLNLLITRCPKRTIENALLIEFCLVVLYPTISADLGIFGSDLWVMMLLYILTGYLKKYKLCLSPRQSIRLFLLVWVFLIAALTWTKHMQQHPWLAQNLGHYAEFYRARMQTLPNLAMAYGLFFYFKQIKLKPSVVINKAAGLTLGVYCMHQVPQWYNYLWEHYFCASYYAQTLYGPKRAIYTICCILIVWLLGSLIELIRGWLSNLLVESRTWFEKMCAGVDAVINDEGSGDDSGLERRRTVKNIILAMSVYITVVTVFFLTGSQRLFQVGTLSSDSPLTKEEISISLSDELEFDGITINGRIYVTNNGRTIRNLSSGATPVKLGISVVDQEGGLVNQDYLHLPITETTLDKGATVPIEIRIDNIVEIGRGNGLRFAVVQEGVSWFEDTALFYYPQPPVEKSVLGTVLFFNESEATANYYCEYGFSEPEPDFTWTDGNEAKLSFSGIDAKGDLELTMHYTTYLDSETVRVLANGKLVEEYMAQGEEEKHIVIPGQTVDNGRLELTIELPDACSPQSLGRSSDDRMLALAMKYMVISRIDTE